MGIELIWGVALLLIGAVIGASAVAWIHAKAARFEVHNIEEVLKMFPDENSYDFDRITKALSGLSDRAQATFIFLYIQAIKGNKRLLSTMNRYLGAIERNKTAAEHKEPALSRPKKGGGLSKGLVGRG